MCSFSHPVAKQEKIIFAVKLIPIVIIFLYLVLNTFSFLTSEKHELINIFDDDAYYYFKIAQNFSLTGQITFDGITTTNGFHPLWLVVLIPFFFVISDPLLVLRAIGVFSNILIGLLAFTCLRHLFVYPLLTYFLSSSLLLFSIISFGITGMEVTLVMPLIVIALLVLSRIRPWLTSPGLLTSLMVLGLVLSLTQLARLDAIWLVITIVVYVFVVSEPKNRIKNAAILSFFPIISGLGYLLLNFVEYRHMIPVSGIAKSLPNNLFNINYVFLEQLISTNHPIDGNLWPSYACLLIIAIVYLSLILLPRPTTERNSLIRENHAAVVVSVFFILFSAYLIFRTSWIHWRWYAYPIIPLVVFLVPTVLNRIEKRLQNHDRTRILIKVLNLILLPLLAIQIGVLAVRFGNWSVPHGELFQYENYIIAERLNLEPPKIFAVGDRAGSFGYFYKGNVIQLEGLVGNYQLLDCIRSNQLMGYMDDYGVEYLMSYVAPNESYSQWNYSTPFPWLSSGPYADVKLCQQSEVQRINTNYSEYTIWKWPSCDAN